MSSVFELFLHALPVNLTNALEKTPSYADGSWTDQEIPCSLRTPKFHCRVYRVCNWNHFNSIHLACPTSFKRILILSSHSYFIRPNFLLLFFAVGLCVETQKCEKISMSMPWRHTGGVEIWLHSFLTLAQDGGEWLTWSPSCFRCLCV